MSPMEVRLANQALNGTTTTGGGTVTGDSTVIPGDAGAGTTTGGAGTPTTGTGAGSGGTTGGTTGGGTTGGSTGGSTGSTGGGGGTTGTPPPTAGIKAGSCDGFKNGPGITNTTITIGNASDINGPVSGLFAAAQQGVKAYVAYFNATSNICGRKLQLVTQDSRTDAGADQIAYQNLCDQSFAAIGSMSAFDLGGARTAQNCGLPDLRAAITTDERAACTTCFAAQGSNAAYYENAPFTYFFKKNPALKQHVAVAYLNAGGAAENANTLKLVAQKLGATNVKTYPIGVTDPAPSYVSTVTNMKNSGVRYVIFIGSLQASATLKKAMGTNGFKPDVYIQDPTIYDPTFVSQVSPAGDGTYVYANFLPFEQASKSKEMQTYLAWLQQVAPGAAPTFYGVFAWSAAALFVQEAVKLGGQLNRTTLINAFKKVNNWTSGGMTSPQNIGGKINGSCWRILQLNNNKWSDVSGGYQCDGVTHR